MFRNFIAWLTSKLREAFDLLPGAVWRFIKKIPHWLYKGAVFLFWLLLFFLSGAADLLGNRFVIATGRLLVAALGIFVFLAIFGFVEGVPRKLLKLLKPFFYLFAWTVFLQTWVESIRNWALREFAEITLLVFAIPFIFWFGKFWSLSAPIHWFLIATCVLLLTCGYLREQARRSQVIIVAEAVRAVLLPIAFGLALVCWMQVIFNLYDHDVRSIRLIENHIGYLSQQSEKWFNFSLPATIGLMVSLIAVSLVVPRWKAVTRASRTQTLLHAAAATVACASSFTFLAQAPFKIQDHQEAKRLEAERKEQSSQGDIRLVTIVSVQHALERMTPEEHEQCRQGMREMLSKLNELAPYREHGRILEALAQRTVEVVAVDSSNSLAALEKKTASEKPSSNRDETLLKLQESELLAGVGSLFSNLVGAATPELKGIAGKFLESLVDKESEHFYEERIRPGLQARVADLLPAVTLFTTSAIVRKFAGRAGENLPTDLVAETTTVEQEVQQEEERVKSQRESVEPEPEVLVEP
jgi:hypothetical protein